MLDVLSDKRISYFLFPNGLKDERPDSGSGPRDREYRLVDFISQWDLEAGTQQPSSQNDLVSIHPAVS